MRKRSDIENTGSRGPECSKEPPASNPPQRLLDTLTRRAEHAEAEARALETENTALRSDRAKAVLAAARAEKTLQESRPAAADASSDAPADSPADNGIRAGMTLRSAEGEAAMLATERSLRQEYARRIDAIRRSHSAELDVRAQAAAERVRREMTLQIDTLSAKLKRAVEARQAAKHERDGAVRAIQKSLTENFSREIDTIRERHAAALSAQSQDAAARTHKELAQQIRSLTGELEDANASLRDAELARNAAVAAVEESLKTEFAVKVDAIRKRHAAELAAQSRSAKQAFAEELMSALSESRSAQCKDMDAQLRKARREVQETLSRARFRWQRHSRRALRRAARVWRRRERTRLAEATRKLEATHREAMDARERQWRDKLAQAGRRRAAHTTERPLRRHARSIGRAWRGTLTDFKRLPGRFAARRPELARLPLGHAGFIAVLTIFLTVQFFPSASVESHNPEPAAQTGTARAMPATPQPKPETRAGKKAAERGQQRASSDRTGISPQEAPRTDADRRLSEDEVRRRLRQNIQKLRMTLSLQ